MEDVAKTKHPAPNPKTITNNYSWTLQAYENQGNLWLKWSTDAPFRAQQDKIVVYKGSGFPTDPTQNQNKSTWADSGNSPWDTGLPFGSGYCCARIAQAPKNGPDVYAEQLTV